MRILLAIGCDSYDLPELSQLGGAENDARAMFDHLVVNEWGDYDRAASKLLLSPTLAEASAAIGSALFDHGPIDEFTLFFAGHGGTKDDAYFLCLRDTQADRLSLTSLPMSLLFSWFNEAKVRQTNIVIDACQSGGVTRDIGTLLNPNIIGKSGSPAVSILAASASDEYAMEVGGRGMCTGAVLQCLTGQTIVQTTRPSLDLVEVGRAVSEMLRAQPRTPVSWGLNLYGRAQFAKNPRFASGTPHVTEVLSTFSADAEAKAYLQDRSDDIWELYLTLVRGFDSDRYLELLRPVCEHFSGQPDTLAAFLDGIASTFAARLRGSDDPFEEPHLYAACVVALLPQMSNMAISSLATDFMMRFCESMERVSEILIEDLGTDTYALLSRQSGHADFFFLPLRVTAILGWLGAAMHTAQWLERPELMSKAKTQTLVALLLRDYSASMVAVSDEQAAPFLSFFIAKELLETTEEVEQVACLLFSTFCQFEGRVACNGATGTEALLFLHARLTGTYKDCDTAIARPTAMLPALLLAYDALGIGDVADQCIRDLDHSNFNIYLPGTHLDFASASMEGGQNHSFQVGHNIWCVQDLRREWSALEPSIRDDATLATPSVRAGALFASLLMPNRQPWFLLLSAPVKNAD